MYKLVAGCCRLEVGCLNASDLVLRRLTIENERVNVDFFRGGELLSKPEVSVRSIKVAGGRKQSGSALIEVTTHRQRVT